MRVIELVKSEYVKVDKSDTISHLICELERSHDRAALVFDKKNLVGITSKDRLLNSRLDLSRTKVDKMIIRIPILTGDEEVQEAARLLFTSNSPILPIVKNKVLKGVVSSMAVVSQIKNFPELGMRRIGDLMTKNPLTINEDEGVGKAIELMRKHKISRLPIVDKKGDILNILSITDVIELYTMNIGGAETHGNQYSLMGPRSNKAYKSQHPHLVNFPVKNITSNTLVTAEAKTTVDEALDTMAAYNISSLVIVEGKKPVGIITVRDLLKLLLQIAY